MRRNISSQASDAFSTTAVFLSHLSRRDHKPVKMSVRQSQGFFSVQFYTNTAVTKIIFFDTTWKLDLN